MGRRGCTDHTLISEQVECCSSGGFSAQEGLAWGALRQRGLTWQGAAEFLWDMRHSSGRRSERVPAVWGVQSLLCVCVHSAVGTATHVTALLVGVTHLQ